MGNRRNPSHMFGSKPAVPAEMASIINPYVAICGAVFLAFIPVPIRVQMLMSASGGLTKYNNTTPREVSVKLQASMEGLIKRLTGCQANAWENLPVFIGAVLCALHAGVSKPVVEQACVNYLACRLLFTVFYIAPGAPDKWIDMLSWFRSFAFIGGMYNCITLYLA